MNKILDQKTTSLNSDVDLVVEFREGTFNNHYVFEIKDHVTGNVECRIPVSIYNVVQIYNYLSSLLHVDRSVPINYQTRIELDTGESYLDFFYNRGDHIRMQVSGECINADHIIYDINVKNVAELLEYFVLTFRGLKTKGDGLLC